MTVIVNGTAGADRILVERLDEAGDRLRIFVNGVFVPIEERRIYRDGGTRDYHTARGILRFPHTMGNDDYRPRWNGEVIEPDA